MGTYNHCGGAHGNQWPSEMTHHSRIVIGNDPTNTNHLSESDKAKIVEIQQKIDEFKFKKPTKKPLSAFEIFKNKQFNGFKSKYPHSSQDELDLLIQAKWHNHLNQMERDVFVSQAQDMQQKIYDDTEEMSL